MPDVNAARTATAQIVGAYCSRNSCAPGDVPQLIRSEHNALVAASAREANAVDDASLNPSVPLKKSIFPGRLVCLDCGRSLVSLRRHLSVAHNLTPNACRARWQLPFDYPMTCADYSEVRSYFARSSGLGRKKNQRRWRAA